MESFMTVYADYVKTENQLIDMAESLLQSGKPILSFKTVAMIYPVKYMENITSTWYSYEYKGVLIVCRFGPTNNTYYCINTTILNIYVMSGIPKQSIYGINRRYTLRNIVNTARQEVLCCSCDYSDMNRRAILLTEKSNVVSYLGVQQGYVLLSSHILHCKDECSCLIILGRCHDLWCDYICIPDYILKAVIDLTVDVRTNHNMKECLACK